MEADLEVGKWDTVEFYLVEISGELENACELLIFLSWNYYEELIGIVTDK